MLFKSNLFRKNGYTSLNIARATQNYTYAEIAEMINEPAPAVVCCFREGYHKMKWKSIIKIAELLGVPKEHYVKGEYTKNLPADVKEYYDLLTGSVIQYPKKRGRVTDEEKEKMHELHKSGKTYQAIAKELGISDQAVGYHLRKLGIYRNLTPADRGKIKELYLEGKSYKEIKAATGRSTATIARVLKGTANRQRKRVKVQPIKVFHPPTETKLAESSNEWLLDIIRDMGVITSATITTKTTKLTIERGV